MKTYTIKEVSEMFSLPASTLRYYEEVGLLTDIPRNGTKRVFEEGHLHRLGSICCFKETGMSIAQLQRFFTYEENHQQAGEMVELLTEHAAQVDEQIRQLQHNREHLQRKLAFYQGIQQAEQTNAPYPDWQDYKNKTVEPLH